MKYVTYEYAGERNVGLIGTSADKIVPASVLGYDVKDMTALIRALNGATPSDLLGRVDAAEGVALSECRLLAPIPEPAQDVLCMGVNYHAHRAETVKAGISYDDTRATTIYFSKRVNYAPGHSAVIDGHFDICDSLDYEVELAVILGRDAKGVPIDRVRDYIFGYTIVNDISARNLQKKHQQWYFGKSLDDFTPMGPWIVERDALSWPPETGIRCYVNDELRQNSNTNCLMNGIDYVVSELSRGMTLKAGTIIATGTPAGVGMGMDPQVWLQKGDVVRCEIDGIGILENTIG